MRLWLPGTPGYSEGPELIRERALELIGPGVATPIFASPNLAVRMRLVWAMNDRASLERALIGSLAWFYCHVLDGVLWGSPAQVTQLHVRRELGHVAGVEVNV